MTCSRPVPVLFPKWSGRRPVPLFPTTVWEQDDDHLFPRPVPNPQIERPLP